MRTSTPRAIYPMQSRHISSSISKKRKECRRRLAILLTVIVVVTMTASKSTGQAVIQADAAPVTVTKYTHAVLTVQPVSIHKPSNARYSLTAKERDLIERVVMAEAGGESFNGQMLVSQCILNACEINAERPGEVVVSYQYAKGRPDPTQSVKDAVAAVFDQGKTVVDAPIIYFYNPSKTTSKWHEDQDFIIAVGGHRFFTEKGAEK